MSFQCATAPNVLFPTREALHEHYKSEWHRYNLRRRAAGLAPINKDVFDKVRALAASQEMQSEQRVRRKDHIKNKNQNQSKEDDDENLTEGASSAAVEDEAPKESMEERVRRAIAEFKPEPCRCLFENVTSDSIESNLDHMQRHHGFIIPDLKYVKDLPALVNYLAEKIHVGRICLQCEKEFRSAPACIAHMEDKAHCRIPWEFEDQVEEYVDYYDFEAADKDAESKDGGTMEIDDTTGELLLRDSEGKLTKRIGPSREFRSLYRMMREESRLVVDAGMANAVKERPLQVYERAGVVTTSNVLAIAAKRRLDKESKAVQAEYERERMARQLRDGFRHKDLIRNRVAKKNVSVARFAHG